MAELEETRRDSRNTLRKVQRYIPGFIGYSQKADLRDADRMFRMIMSQKMLMIRNDIEQSVKILEAALLFEDTESLTFLLNTVKRIESEIGYADSGLSWLASDMNIKGEEIERLYEFDAQLLDIATLALKQSDDIKSACSTNNKHMMKIGIADMRVKLTLIEDTFRKRMTSLRNVG